MAFSMKKMNKADRIIPNTVGPSPPSLRAGTIRLKAAADSIIPAAKPSNASYILWGISLKIITGMAPRPVARPAIKLTIIASNILIPLLFYLYLYLIL